MDRPAQFMNKAILATKVGMTQIFNEDGVLTPVTVLQAGPCVVTQVKTQDNDGYSAVQVGFADKRENLVNKPMKGHFDKAGVSCKRFVRELINYTATLRLFQAPGILSSLPLKTVSTSRIPCVKAIPLKISPNTWV